VRVILQKATFVSARTTINDLIGRVGTIPSGVSTDANSTNCRVVGGKALNGDLSGGDEAPPATTRLSLMLDKFLIMSSVPLIDFVAVSAPMMLRALTARCQR
jgi:hypothetical protein